MIFYSPITGNAISEAIKYQPKHCFLITKLGKPIPRNLQNIHKAIVDICDSFDYVVIDANAKKTGKDFLEKIWREIYTVPLCVAVIHEEMSESTKCNIFYELGIAQAMGKETVVIKSAKVDVPSDFVRTEYIEYNKDFKKNFSSYMKHLINQTAEAYEVMADNLERNPVLSIDYLKRSYLISGAKSTKLKVKNHNNKPGFESRANNSIELLSSSF
jgi:hypothetical protein